MRNVCSFISHSAEVYYNYLKKNNKGMSQTKVEKIKRKNDYEFTITFQNKIRDFDFISFVLCDGELLPVEKFTFNNITEYSAEVKAPLRYITRLAESESIFLVSDFKQLVWRIKTKFEDAPPFKIPNKAPALEFNPKDFSKVSFTSMQLQAIKNIFSSPMSYVWGGAGSGKTKYVLAYSILTYLKKSQRILLCAPTNIALENALSVIIPIAEANGIEASKIFRSGHASMDFYQNFPKCCNDYTLQKKHKQLTAKKEMLAQYVHMAEAADTLSVIKNSLSLYFSAMDEIDSLNDENDKLTIRLNLAQLRLNDSKQELQSVNVKINSIAMQKKSFIYKVKCRFADYAARSEAELAELEQSAVQVCAACDKYSADIKQYETNISENTESITNLQKDIDDYKNDIDNSLVPISRDMLDCSDYSKLLQQILDYRKKYTDFMHSCEINHPEIDFSNRQNLFDMIEQFEIEIHENLSKSAERDGNCYLYGCTLDRLASVDVKDFSHVFLDEACYSPVAKAAQLFLYDCPITFLGDHLQLPPVCEINERELQNKEYSAAFLWSQSSIFTPSLAVDDIQYIFDNFMSNTSTLPNTLSVSLLNETHRFGADMAILLDRYIYKSGFHSALETETSIKYINAPTNRYTRDQNRSNRAEADAIKKYISNIENASEIAILTPYNDQVKLLKETLPRNCLDNILTIHKAQGQEWDTVIISVVDTTRRFFTDVNNFTSRGREILNTAISRSKRELIIVCDAQYWLGLEGQLISELIKLGEEIKI